MCEISVAGRYFVRRERAFQTQRWRALMRAAARRIMARVESGEVCKTVGERIANRRPGGGRNQETMALFGYLGILHQHRPPRLGHLDSCHSLGGF